MFWSTLQRRKCSRQQDWTTRLLLIVRFVHLVISKGVTIANAHVQFIAAEVTTGTTLTLQSQATNTTLPFTNTQFNRSSQLLSAAQVRWSPAPWMAMGQVGAKSLMQEV